MITFILSEEMNNEISALHLRNKLNHSEQPDEVKQESLNICSCFSVGIFLFVSLQVWLTLADQYLHSISIDWDKTLRFAFNERSNPDDDSLGIQIVKVITLCPYVGGGLG